MIQYSKHADERREAGPMEIWCLHGAVGVAADWRDVAGRLAKAMVGTRAVDLWRFLEPGPLALPDFARALNAEPGDEVFRGTGRALMGYSMGGRLALHALLENGHPWQAAIIISAHPGLENPAERTARRGTDTGWAGRAFAGDWQQFLAAWNAQPVFGHAAPRDSEELRRLVARRREVAQSFVNWSLAEQDPLWDRLAEITIPVLWIAGANDPKFLEIGRRTTGLLPRGVLEVAPDAGHRVPWEAADWLAETVARFVKVGDSPA